MLNSEVILKGDVTRDENRHFTELRNTFSYSIFPIQGGKQKERNQNPIYKGKGHTDLFLI